VGKELRPQNTALDRKRLFSQVISKKELCIMIRLQTMLTVLVIAGTTVLPGSAGAKNGSCILKEAKETLLGASGNGVVDRIHNDLGTLSGKLATLKGANTFYPACTEPHTPACDTRQRLITKFEAAVQGQVINFEAFLDDVVSARDADCLNCRYVKYWSIMNTAGYPNVTPIQISSIKDVDKNLAAASAFEAAKKACTDDTCKDTLDYQIRQVLDPIPDQYGDNGFPGGPEFAKQMQATLANIKKACPASQ
jgi:hypothetical protein